MYTPSQPMTAEVSPKLSAQGISLTPNNGSFPRNFRPILPNAPADEQQFRLRWEQHIPNQQAMFARLLDRGSFCDVALACEEKLLNVHKLVLSACSTYFESILTHFDKRDPVIILKDVKYETMLALVHFMYKGEVCLDQSQLAEVLDAAHALKIKGLSEDINDNGRNHNASSVNNSYVSKPSESPKVGIPAAPTFVRAKRIRRRGRPKKEIAETPLIKDENVEKLDGVQKRKRSVGRPRRDMGSTEDLGDAVAVEDSAAEEPDAKKRQSLVPLGRPRKESEDKSIANSPEAGNFSTGAVGAESTPKKSNSDGSLNDDDIVQLDEYIKRGGTYQKYWSEPWVSHVMDAIKRKELSMQDGANYLGMKYASLYGRYRVHHGYLINREIIKQKKSRHDMNDDAGASDADISQNVSENPIKTERSSDWEPSMNLEPIIQIDEDENASKAVKESDVKGAEESSNTKKSLSKRADDGNGDTVLNVEGSNEKKEADKEIESPSILGL